MKLLRRMMSIIGGMASLSSGLFWLMSAKAASNGAAITGTSKNARDAIHTLQTLALQANSRAAFAAAVAGFAVAVALLLETD